MNYELGITGKTNSHNSLFPILNFLRFLLFSVKISGESMLPTLVPGRRYFASSLFSPRVGDAIVFKNPVNKAQVFVKKITHKERDGYVVAGERAGSTGSQDFGIVSRALVIGKILTW